MTSNRIAGAIAVLAMLAAPAVASAHRGHDDDGRHHGRHHHAHAKKAHVKDLPAGTVTSFTAGELTITLTGGKTYSATVTDKTVIRCKTAAPQTPTPATARTSRHGHDDGNGRCTTADLVPGTQVADADLSLSHGGTWKKVKLLK
jgi:hypothetical protein